MAPLLKAIANSGKKMSTLLYAPGALKPPVLGVTASLSSGTWGAGTTSLPVFGKTDLLLTVSMEYGAPAVPASDAPAIAKALDEIAEAIVKEQR